MIKTVMVTGSSGTVGTALCRLLLDKGYDVIPIDKKGCLWDEEINKKTIICNLTKNMKNFKIRKKPDIIFHLAANARVHDLVVKPQKSYDNYTMIHNMLEYARLNGIKRFVFASSREVYGEIENLSPRSESMTSVANIKSPYTASKFSGEALVNAYKECYDIETVIVRLSNVYGRFDASERLVPAFTFMIHRNVDLTIFGKNKKLDFTYIDDVSDGLLCIIKHFNKASGHTFNLSRGESVTITEIAKLIIDYFNSDSKISYKNIRTGEITSFTGDISLAKKLLGYNPKVSIKEGIPKSIEWYLNVLEKDIRAYQMLYQQLKRRKMIDKLKLTKQVVF